jgi:Domain of unknown function (DUF4932)
MCYFNRPFNMAIRLSILLLFYTTSIFGQKRKLNVQVDERMEFLTVIQVLSDYPVLNQSENLEYRKDIEKYFEKYRQHSAVQLTKKIYRRFFGFDKPVNYIYHFSFPDFQQTSKFSEIDLVSYKFNEHKDTLNLLLKLFKDFYKKSNFKTFFDNHKPFYNSLTKNVKIELAKFDIINILEKHYGERNTSYNLVLCPMLHDGGYALSIENEKSTTFYAVVGPTYDSLSLKPTFDTKLLLSEYIIHEFSHNFCNPLIDKYFEELDRDSCLLNPINTAMNEQGYKSWKTCLYEHIVRANEVVINEVVFGKEKSREVYKDFLENGKWIYLKGIIPIIREQYLTNRNKYKTQDGIMPLIVKYFNDEKKNCH